MSVLLTAVAVRGVDARAVVDAVSAFHEGRGEAVSSQPHGTRDEYPVEVYEPDANGWVVVMPHYIVSPDDLAPSLSAALGTTATGVSIYEDVFWTHCLAEGGALTDRFVSLPDYFGPGEYGPEHRGDPARVAAAIGCPVEAISPYFRQFSVDDLGKRKFRRRPPKAHPDDEFDLLDGWVVVDLWNRMGIHAPDHDDASTTRHIQPA